MEGVGSQVLLLFFLLLLFAPFIPVLKHLPKWIPIHRIIWRDWYEKLEAAAPAARKPAKRPGKQSKKNTSACEGGGAS